MTPIALTDAQLELVRAAADHLPRDARGAFLEMIAQGDPGGDPGDDAAADRVGSA